MKTDFFKPERPRLFSHRGSKAYPENTLPAFQDAMEMGLRYFELDVWCSRDGVVMVHHDASLSRICGIDKPITSLSCSEIQGFDAGFGYCLEEGSGFPFRGKRIRVPTLEEVLSIFTDRLFTIEIKDERDFVAAAVLDVVAKTGSRQRVMLASQYDEVVQRVRMLDRDIPTNFGFGEIMEFYAWLSSGMHTPYVPAGNALQIPPMHESVTLVTMESVEASHSLNLEMHVWTINEATAIKNLLSFGVDGIMSDYPHLLMKFA